MFAGVHGMKKREEDGGIVVFVTSLCVVDLV